MVSTEGRRLCRHCHESNVNRPRGLCWGCYYRPGVRDLYPVHPLFGRQGVRDTHSTRPLPPAATPAFPGTPEKLRVLEERAASQLALFHPQDATLNWLEKMGGGCP